MYRRWVLFFFFLAVLPLGVLALRDTSQGGVMVNLSLIPSSDSFAFLNLSSTVPVNLSVCISDNGIMDYCAYNHNFLNVSSYMLGPFDNETVYFYVVTVTGEDNRTCVFNGNLTAFGEPRFQSLIILPVDTVSGLVVFSVVILSLLSSFSALLPRDVFLRVVVVAIALALVLGIISLLI